ncbi:MAG: deoxynucleoside kinase [bacterium]|nr:deoxynucleoside kinase [bacterium]
MSEYICVVGIDGSGKSTASFRLFENLSKTRKTGYVGDSAYFGEKSKISEIDNLWQVRLKRKVSSFAKNKKNKSVYKLSKLLDFILRKKIMTALDKRFNADILVEDGSSLINTLAWGRFYHKNYVLRKGVGHAADYLCGKPISAKENLGVVKNLPELFVTRRLVKLSVPDKVFFLKLNPKAAVKRTQTRGKPLQKHENKKFLDELQKSYELTLTSLIKRYRINVCKISVDNLTKDQVQSKMKKEIKWKS